MTFWARVNQYDQIQEVTDVDPNGRFHPSLIWRELPPGSEVWVDSNFTLLEDGTLEAPIHVFHFRFLNDVAGIRWVKENEFIIFEENEIWCGRDSVAMLNAIKEQFSAGLITSIEWKCKNGNYLTLDSTKLNNLLNDILAHKIKAFKAEKILRDEIVSMTNPFDFFTYNLPERFETVFNNL